MARREAPVAPTPRPGPLWVALAASVAGIVVSSLLVRLHVRAHAGYASFCAISETVNCDRVATSGYSVLLGVPVAAWGVLGYAVAATLAAWGLARRGPHPAWPRGLLLVVAAVAALASLALAVVSKALIGAWCLLCIASWALSGVLLVAAWRACLPDGPRAAIVADAAALRSRRGRSIAGAVAALAALALAVAAYPRYWERPASAAPRGRGTSGATATVPPAGAQPAAAPGTTVVVEFSDYECPFCARAHEQVKALLAARPDVKVVRRHFPLDPSCNPAVKRPMHPSACGLARAGICAETLGRFEALDDLLYRNQQRKEPLSDLVARAGLDPRAFEACLASPETERRLAGDIAEAMRVGVPATPSYYVGGRIWAGQLPPDLAPPPTP